MSDNTVTLRVSRSAYIETNYDVALIRLDTIEHLVGQPMMVRYYADAEKTTINTITVIGKKNGIGRDCYSIISVAGEFVVNGVHEELPDVSSLVNGGKYIAKYNGNWNLIYIVSGSIRTIDPEFPEGCIRDLNSGYNWYHSGTVFKREDDFLTPGETADSIRESQYRTNPPKINVSLNEGLEQIVSNRHDPFIPVFRISIVDYRGINIAPDCDFIITSDINGNEDIRYSTNGFVTLYSQVDRTTKYTIKAVVNLNGVPFTLETEYTIYFIPRTYYAKFGTTYTPADFMAGRVPLSNMMWAGENDLVFNLNLEDEYFALCVPSCFSKFTHIYDKHELDYIDDYTVMENVKYGADNYTIYCKKDAVTINNFKQVFTK